MPEIVGGLDLLAPRFALEVEGTDIGPSLSGMVRTLEYEETDGLAGIMKFNISNPDFILNKKKILQVGNELALWFGYGTKLEYVGRAIIVKRRPNFPANEMPSIEIVAYTRDYKLADNEPDKGKDRVYKQTTYDAVVSGVADRWKFDLDIDPHDAVVDVMQKSGMTDWELVKGCANITGYWLWADADDKGKWTLHFKDPKQPIVQEVKLTMGYNQGPGSLLESFEAEDCLKGGLIKVRVLATDTVKNELINEEVEATDTPADTISTGQLAAEIVEVPASREAIKLFVGDFSFQIVPVRRFKTAADAVAWATQWFNRHRADFITAKGRTVIGVPSLRARHVHKIEVGDPEYDGDYYFSRVRHTFSADDGYKTEFDCRKKLEG